MEKIVIFIIYTQVLYTFKYQTSVLWIPVFNISSIESSMKMNEVHDIDLYTTECTQPYT